MSRRRGGRLRINWFVAVLLIVAVWSVLVVNAYVHPVVGNDVEGAAARNESTTLVPESLSTGGPVIDVSGATVRTASMPDRTIALTFDDGPDPHWTPEILRVLNKHGVRATFFVVGSLAMRHPELVQAIRAAGSEVGIHSFSHVDLAKVSAEEVADEVGRTQTALIGAIGETSYLSRPPYSSHPSAITGPQFDTLLVLAGLGQVTVLSDIDSRDWAREGVDRIVANSVPYDGSGGILLMHDGGGDRSQTVAALDRLIPLLESQGYRFTTVTEGLGMPPANRPADLRDQRRADVQLTVVAVAVAATEVLVGLLLVAGLLVLARLALSAVFAYRHHRLRRPDRFSWGDPVTDPVSVIVPAYNERRCIEATVRSLLASDHPVEVIVVDDGSTDGTADLVEALRLPRVRVIRQRNSGKAHALNTGIAHAHHEIIVMMDADTVCERTTIRELVQPFADPTVGAVAGNAKISNRRRIVARWQHIEYVIGFNLDRRMYDLLRCMPTVPGAVGAFRRAALRRVGGVSDETLAEDTDVTMAIVATGWRVVYQPTARAWTEAPESLGELWRQRYRWSYGTLQSLWKHRRPLRGSDGTSRFSRFGLTHVALFQVIFPLLAPLIDLFLVYGLIFLDPVDTVAVWGALLLLQAAVAVYAFRLEGEPLRDLLLLPLQQIVYRQLMYLVLIRSVASSLGGVRLRWQQLQRSGAANASRAAEVAALVPGNREIEGSGATVPVRLDNAKVIEPVEGVPRDDPGPSQDRVWGRVTS